jgi:diguanylate cyclase (GGDEF)-like protein/PAS domain S-box-containing protein
MINSASRQPYRLEAEIYLPLVDSLFKEVRTLVIGSFIMASAIVATYIKTGELLLLSCASVFAAVAVVRLMHVQAYRASREGITTVKDARRWELGYVTGAATSVALLGTWAYTTFAATAEPYAHLVSFTMTIGYVIGVFGRNFGSPKFVLIQILCAWLPLTVALLLYGDAFHWFFAALLVPFFLAVKFISERVRSMLLDAITATRDIGKLAARFDTALTNMPHGICMFDSNGRISVVNERFAQLFGLDSVNTLKGWSAERLMWHCRRARLIEAQDAKRIARKLKWEENNDPGELVIEVAGGRTWQVSARPMDGGGLVALVHDVSERMNAERLIAQMANYDALTGLPNRNLFHEYFKSRAATGGRMRECALHFIDLDHFKQVNDSLGHSFGDRLLERVAKRLQAILREDDIASRFGGDEFVVLQCELRDRSGAEALARRIVSELSRPYLIDGHEIVIGASVGVAWMPLDERDIERMLRSADMALYEAKASGRGTIRFFEDEMDAKAQARRRIELDLRNAIQRDEFEAYFQPIVNLSEDRIGTCEALLRWVHPERGVVAAGEFISIAEETGTIVELGRIVMEKACRACASWPADVNVAVNISPIQFDRGDVVALVTEVLAVTGLEPRRLEVEITESSLLRQSADVTEALQRLRQLGIRISLDDFGTGYSSLSYLHRFPLDKIKIDRSFMRDVTREERSLTLLRGVTRLSADLGHCVVVEGIETEEQLCIVSREESIHEAQGFLFGKALPGLEMHDLLWATPAHMLGRPQGAVA